MVVYSDQYFQLAQIHVTKTLSISVNSYIHSQTANHIAKQRNSEQQLFLRSCFPYTPAFLHSQPATAQTNMP
jgi:hypothetical protein